MVRLRLIAVLCLLLLPAAGLLAQNYSVGDTVTEYPNKGTFYHDRFEGRKTANGEIFDQNKFTAAHWKIKLGTMVMVTNRNTGLQVIVKVNDRCPKRGVFDLSHRAATAIGIRGCQPVTVRILPEGYEERWAAQDAQFDSVRSRLHPTAPPAPGAPAMAKKAAPKPEKANAVAESTPQNRSDCFNLWIGTAQNHAEAFEMIGKLPETYRQKVQVDELDGDTLGLTVVLNLPETSLKELAQALRHSFPDCRMVGCE